MRTSQKEIKKMIGTVGTVDISYAGIEQYKDIINKEEWLRVIAYSVGTYGCNGKVYIGNKTGTLYIIIGHTSSLYLFG